MISLMLSAGLILGAMLFLLFFFRANGGILFFAACTAVVLLQSLDPAVVSTAAAIVPKEGEAYVKLLVLLLSLVFAALMFKGSVKSSHLALHGVVVVVGSALLLLVLPELTALSWLLEVRSNMLWQTAKEYETLIVTLGFSLSLLALLMGKSGGGHGSKHSK
jgi:hypothetical protein